MNREILFRGKRIDNGEWIDGSLVIRGTQYFIFTGEIKNFGGMINWVWYEVDLETVCEYTRLTDKNGRKIFEGDIIKYGDSLHKVVFENRFGTSYFGVVFEDRGEVWSFGHSCSPLDMTVIGNIFDNQELLKGGVAE